VPNHDSQRKTQRKKFSRDSTRNTLTVAISLSLVCSILVASTAVLLKPVQQKNEERYRQRIILEVAGLMQPDASIESLFESIEPRMVELASGEYVESPSPSEFDASDAASDPSVSTAIPDDLDIAGIRRRALHSPVYLVRVGEELEQVILPVYGSGLWSTLYGYLALTADGAIVKGLRFYSHAETPGLGDQIDDPDWREQWVGKQIYGPDGQPRIEVIRGFVQYDDSSGLADATQFQVDGLSGATLTGRGVMQLVRYWTGPHGFGPYLKNLKQDDGATQ